MTKLKALNSLVVFVISVCVYALPGQSLQ